MYTKTIMLQFMYHIRRIYSIHIVIQSDPKNKDEGKPKIRTVAVKQQFSRFIFITQHFLFMSNF
jgi:hypothetical protein